MKNTAAPARLAFRAIICATSILFALLILSANASAQLDTFSTGDGHETTVTFSGTTTLNYVAPLNAAASAGASSLTIGTVRNGSSTATQTRFEAGRLVLIIQSSGYPSGSAPSGTQTDINLSYNNVGRWELARIDSGYTLGSSTVPLTAPLENSFAATGAQVIAVPEYTTVSMAAGNTLTGHAWNGSSGGVVAFLANSTVSISGTVNANGLGFRGGQQHVQSGNNDCTGLDDVNGGGKGEGIVLGAYGASYLSRGNIANGAGGGNCHNAGGGGGGNGGRGGVGGNSWDGNDPVGGYGGAELTYSAFDHALFGGGGGAGQSNNSTGGVGGAGGGFVFMRGASLSGTGTISARGNAGGNALNDGGGGGGAGGVVYARFTGAASCTLASVAGGNGGNADDDHGPAGGGAGGRMVFQSASGTCTTSVSNGTAGVENTAGTTNGAGPAATNDGTSSGAIDTTSGGLTAPTAAATSPANGAAVATATPTISGTGTVGATIRVTIDGTFVGTTTVGGGGTWSYTTSTLGAGSHTYTVQPVYQGIVGSATSSRSLTVDLTTPTVNITAPPAQTNSTASQNIAFTTSDNVAIATVQCRIDGGAYASCTSPFATGTVIEGGQTVYVRATDTAGNITTQSVTFTVDTTGPAAPTITGGPTGTVAATTASLTFTAAESGGSLQCQIDGGSWTTCTSPANYSSLTNASHTFSVRQLDAVGNVGSVASRIWTVDTIAPAAPVIGSPTTGSVTTDNTPTISGTAEASSTLNLFANGNPIGTTTTNGAGNWTITLSTPLADGTYALTATASDGVGNTSVASTSVALTIDTTAPAAPTITNPADGDATTDTTPLIEGTTEPGATVTVYVDGSPVGTAVADGNGDWSFTPSPALAEGQYEISASATDTAGIDGATSPSVGITIDQTAPNAPQITGPADGSSTSDATPAISGTAEANSTVSVFRDGILMGTANADSSGNWAFTPNSSLADDTYAITATAEDAAGNTSTESNTVDVTIDTAAPSAPVVSTPVDGSSTADATPTYTGTAEAGSTVAITIDGNAPVNVTADGSGNWTYTPSTPLSEGTHSVLATATDAAGNPSTTSATNDFTVDTTAPSLTIDTPTSNGTIGDNTPSIAFTATDAGSLAAECSVDGAAFVACTSPFTTAQLADGSHTVSVRVTDAAGNPTQQSVTFTVDTVGPQTTILSVPAGDSNSDSATFEFEADEPTATFACSVDGGAFSACVSPLTLTGLTDGPHSFAVRAVDTTGNADTTPATYNWTVDTLAPVSPAIVSPVDGATIADTTPAVTGTAEEFSTVTVLIDGSPVGTTTADANGDWTFTVPSALASGAHAITATAEDVAGNVSAESSATDITIDTTAPDTSITTQPAAEANTDAATFEFTATEAVDRFECSIDGGSFTTCTSPRNLSNLADGDHTFAVRAVDVAGNTDASPATYTWNIDTAAPTGPVITSPTDNQKTNDATPTVSGTAEPNSTVTIYVDGNPIGTVNVNNAGNWTINSLTLSDGSHSVYATAEDAVGNVSVPSTTIDFEIDTVEPTGSVSEQSGSGGAGTPPTFVIVSDDPDATVRCSIDGGTPVVCTTPYTPSGLAPGNHTLVVSFTDGAGNTTTSTANFTVVGATNNPPSNPPSSPPATGSADPLPAECFPKGITIYELKVVGSKLQIRGFARSQYVGKEVSINFQPTKSKAIAKTKVNGDGSFFVTTKAPKKSLRKKGTTRYRAVVDGETSLWFKLDRRMGSNLASYSGGKLNVSGFLSKPLDPKATLSVTVRSGCNDPWASIGNVKINPSKGTFSASLPYDTTSRVLFVRMSAKVRKSAKSKATLTTYSFVIPVVTNR